MASIVMSNEAENDLETIGDYIAEQLKSPKAALDTIRGIKKAIDKLADFPLKGRRLSSVALIDTEYRFIGYGNYLAFYRLCGDTVFIDRVLYGKRDYISILFSEELDEETQI